MYDTMKFTWIASTDIISWYKFKLRWGGEQSLLEPGNVLVIDQRAVEVLVVEFNKSGLSGTLVVQNV